MEKYYCDHCKTLSDTTGKCKNCGRDIINKIEIEIQYQANKGSFPKGE